MVRILCAGLTVLALAGVAGCAAPPSGLDLSLTRPTIDRKYVVALLPPATPAATNQLHSWHVELRSAAGAPVSGAGITVDGGMPQHGTACPRRLA